VEIGHLGERYAEDGLNQVAVDLDRSPDAISSQARRLGLRSPDRHRRRALARASNNKSVNTRFFDNLTGQVAYVLGYIWVRGRVKTSPRHVLRLRCPASREASLLEVRRLLASQHRVQGRQDHVVCEISSCWLVKSLIGKYGCPPSRDEPAPPLPILPATYLPDLARGLLIGSGSVSCSQITWTGTGRAMNELDAIIRLATGVSAPVTTRSDKNYSLSWHAPDEVRTLSAWLRLGIPAHVEDESKGTSLSSLPSAV
jgi:hypothetical protein